MNTSTNQTMTKPTERAAAPGRPKQGPTLSEGRPSTSTVGVQP